MLQVPPKFVFFGSPEFAVEVLKGLLDTGWRPALVITETDKPVGRKKVLTPTPVKVFASIQGIRVETPSTQEEILSLLDQNNLDLGIVAAYGKILSREVLELPSKGMINVHPSLLPRHRGASPIQATILAGDQKTGITYMLMDQGLDTGPIIGFTEIELTGQETTADLTKNLAQIASQTIVPILELYLAGTAIPRPQDAIQATYSSKIHKVDGEVALLSDSPQILDRKFRAYFPWPGIFSLEFGKRLIIREAELQRGIFVVKRLQWEGGKVIDGRTFARVHKNILTTLPKTVIFEK